MCIGSALRRLRQGNFELEVSWDYVAKGLEKGRRRRKKREEEEKKKIRHAFRPLMEILSGRVMPYT